MDEHRTLTISWTWRTNLSHFLSMEEENLRLLETLRFGILGTQIIWSPGEKSKLQVHQGNPAPVLQDPCGAGQSLPFTELSSQALQPCLSSWAA